MLPFRYFTKKSYQKLFRRGGILILALFFFLSNIPFGNMDQLLQNNNIVDQMWLAQNSSTVVDALGPKVAEAAQVTIDAATLDATDEFGPSPTVVFTTDQIGYTIYVETGNDLVYSKTTNGGSDWSAPVVIDNVLTGWTNVSVWYDQWTPGDSSGTKIHIAASDVVTNDVYYTYLDVNGDALKGSVVPVIVQSVFTATDNAAPSITKGAGGDLFLTANFTTTAGGYVYKSSDGAGAVWGDIIPTGWSSASLNQIQLLPLLTGSDIIAIRADTGNNDIDYRIYNETDNIWGGTWTTIGSLTENTTYDQWFSASVNKATGAVYLTFANYTANAANDVEFWSFSDTTRGWTKKSDVMTNRSDVVSPVPLYNNVSGDIYVAFIQGDTNYVYNGAALGSITYIYYKKSSDGGATWGSRTGVLTDDLGDDYRYLRGNLASSNRLYIAFYDDDDNSIFGTSIANIEVEVEANIDTLITDATDEYGPSPSTVFTDDDVGYQFFVRSNIVLDSTDEFGPSPSTVFVDANVGYTFYVDAASQDLAYRKTSNGGTNWSGANIIDTTNTGWTNVSVWYDQWTPGDTTGTKIHIAAADDIVDDVFYTYLDTSNDSLRSSLVTVITQTAFAEAENVAPSITKGVGGNLFITANFSNTVGGYVYKSVNGGDNWSNTTPGGWSTVSIDQVQLVSLNTGGDILAIRADTANNEMDYQIYNETGDSWAGTWTSIGAMVENTTYDQWFSATLNKATGDVLLSFANYTANAAGDIELWTFADGTRTWTKKTDVVSNLATILAPVPFYEMDTGYIYVAYIRGTLATTVHVYYKRSIDGGTTWDAESAALSTLGDDHKYLRGNMMSNDNLFVVWHNDDTEQLKGDRILSPVAYDLAISGLQSIVYRKTTNGGLSWGTPYSIATFDTGVGLAVWYDQWTPGDTTGTKIHIALSEDNLDDYYYLSFDTANDKADTIKSVLLGTVITESGVGVPGITKSAAGNLFITGNFNTTAGGKVAKSVNNGVDWTDITPGSWSSAALDQIQLVPLLTGSDVMALRADTAGNDLDYRIYGEGDDTWGGSWVTVGAMTDNATYDQWFSATIRKASGDVYVTLANNTSVSTNDLEFWSFDDTNRGANFVKGTNIYTDSATVIMPVPVVNENNGDIYALYLRGTLGTLQHTYYKKSMDGGATWSGESEPLSPGIMDNVKSLRASFLGSDRLYAVWYNDDLNDIYGNTVADQWQLQQSSYRLFANNNSTDVGAVLANQDTSAVLTAAGAQFRLRMLVKSSGKMPTLGNSLKLQFAQKVGTCDTAFVGESYTDVTASTVIAYNDNTSADHGAGLTTNANDPVLSAYAVVNQSYLEANNFSNNIANIPSGQVGKWDFSLKDNSALSNTGYCFRVISYDGSLLSDYEILPEVTTSNGGSATLSFSISNNSAGFGTLVSDSSRYATSNGAGSGTQAEAHSFSAATNAELGYIITVNGTTLNYEGNYISAIGGVNTIAMAGTEQFGMRITASGGTGGVTDPYGGSGFAFDTTQLPDMVASSTTNDNENTIYSVRYLGNISNTTKSGQYGAVLNYVATISF